VLPVLGPATFDRVPVAIVLASAAAATVLHQAILVIFWEWISRFDRGLAVAVSNAPALAATLGQALTVVAFNGPAVAFALAATPGPALMVVAFNDPVATFVLAATLGLALTVVVSNGQAFVPVTTLGPAPAAVVNVGPAAIDPIGPTIDPSSTSRSTLATRSTPTSIAGLPGQTSTIPTSLTSTAIGTTW